MASLQLIKKPHINDLVPITREVINEARLIDEATDLWQARMVRWAKWAIATKSLVCGIKWEIRQDELHKWERLREWQDKYMPGYPVASTQHNLPAWPTADMNTDERYERDVALHEIRQQAIWEKAEAGIELTKSEEGSYANMLEVERIQNLPDIQPEVLVSDKEAFDNKDGTSATVWTSGCLDGEVHASQDGKTGFGAAEWVDSPPQSIKSTGIEENTNWGLDTEEKAVDDWGLPVDENALCAVWVHPNNIAVQYESGLRGKDYEFPAGLGKHIRPAPISWDSRGSIIGDDAFDNIPIELPYIVKVDASQPVNKESRGLITQHGDKEAWIDTIYGPEVCHKDNSWLVTANPTVTQTMMEQNQKFVDSRKKKAAIETLKVLKMLDSDLSMLLPMVTLVLKDPSLCMAIHQELVDRDLGFLAYNKATNHRFHGRIETILNNLDRWAKSDIESAIEDVRLILEDHELVLEIIDALNGGQTQKDRPLIDPHFTGASCGHCGKDLKELVVIYGRDHSTLMATGCRVCEDVRLKRAHDLLWKWYKHPELINDEQYKKVFGVEKGFKLPKAKDEVCIGNFDLVEYEE